MARGWMQFKSEDKTIKNLVYFLFPVKCLKPNCEGQHCAMVAYCLLNRSIKEEQFSRDLAATDSSEIVNDPVNRPEQQLTVPKVFSVPHR